MKRHRESHSPLWHNSWRAALPRGAGWRRGTLWCGRRSGTSGDVPCSPSKGLGHGPPVRSYAIHCEALSHRGLVREQLRSFLLNHDGGHGGKLRGMSAHLNELEREPRRHRLAATASRSGGSREGGQGLDK